MKMMLIMDNVDEEGERSGGMIIKEGKEAMKERSKNGL